MRKTGLRIGWNDLPKQLSCSEFCTIEVTYNANSPTKIKFASIHDALESIQQSSGDPYLGGLYISPPRIIEGCQCYKYYFEEPHDNRPANYGDQNGEIYLHLNTKIDE